MLYADFICQVIQCILLMMFNRPILAIFPLLVFCQIIFSSPTIASPSRFEREQTEAVLEKFGSMGYPAIKSAVMYSI